MGFLDKMKLAKALSDKDTLEKIKELVVLRLMTEKAAEATAACLAEGLAEDNSVESITLSAGECGFLPLNAVALVSGEEKAIKALQPAEADFDYAKICADYNALLEKNEDEKAEFFAKLTPILSEKFIEKGVADEKFEVKLI